MDSWQPQLRLRRWGNSEGGEDDRVDHYAATPTDPALTTTESVKGTLQRHHTTAGTSIQIFKGARIRRGNGQDPQPPTSSTTTDPLV